LQKAGWFLRIKHNNKKEISIQYFVGKDAVSGKSFNTATLLKTKPEVNHD
jgi:hypothetical protein